MCCWNRQLHTLESSNPWGRDARAREKKTPKSNPTSKSGDCLPAGSLCQLEPVSTQGKGHESVAKESHSQGGGGLFVCLFGKQLGVTSSQPHSSTLSNSTSHTWEVPDCPGQVWMHFLWPQPRVYHTFERLPPKHKSWAPKKPRQSSWEAPAALGPGQRWQRMHYQTSIRGTKL